MELFAPSATFSVTPAPQRKLLAPVPRSVSRAGNGTRTRDPNLGKVVLYQLSYSRNAVTAEPSGGEGNRTPDLLNAIQALSQLSYTPGSQGACLTPVNGCKTHVPL